ncbi:MAG: hypothetical protein HY238_06130 [Acidobacteria bacterium]|nr:hypothetical protein [Acidobacteriota bacterium]
MGGRSRTGWQTALAVMAALALLVVSNAALLPGHWHNSPQGRSCDICRSGQLPAPTPLVRTEIQSPAPVEWHSQSFEPHTVFEPVFASSSPRAPPV